MFLALIRLAFAAVAGNAIVPVFTQSEFVHIVRLLFNVACFAVLTGLGSTIDTERAYAAVHGRTSCAPRPPAGRHRSIPSLPVIPRSL